jgi:alpha-mannosidase
MSLSPEWRRRIEHWQKTIPQMLYRPLGAVPVKAFFTHEQLTQRQAQKKRFRPIATGTPWGSKWQYGWFSGTFTIPAQADGQRIVMRTGTSRSPWPASGGDTVVYIDGVAAGTEDWAHEHVPVVKKGKAGRKYQFLAEIHAGHGNTPVGHGPVPHGRVPIPEPPPTQRTVGEATFGIWDEELFQAWMDFETLLQVRDNIDSESLRVVRIDDALRRFTIALDLELPPDELRAAIKNGRACLRDALACHNGPTTPEMYCFGHSHIDVAWLWPLSETERKCTRTFSTQLALMAEYPEYKFLQSQPHLYRMVKRHYPDLYRRIKKAVAAGQWRVEGGMWVEADTNISGGEALVRQFLHGKHFCEEEFGVECELLWLPDVFGYSGAMPQIMKGCGIKYFSTQKIFWAYNGGDLFPYNTFYWQGIDGTQVFAHIHNDYNAKTDPRDVIGRWKERVQKDGIDARLYPFGYGDGGGGPTRKHLEFLRRQHDLEGVPKTKVVDPVEFFHDEEKKPAPLPVYVGELYFQAHRGTYTSQAKTKKGNRKSEIALREAEMWGAAAHALAGFDYPLAAMDELWKAVLLNQFHDIIPGSSIERVYVEAEAAYQEVIAGAERTADKAARAFLKKDAEAVTVFNSLSWKRDALVALPRGFRGVKDQGGKALAVQTIGGAPFAWVKDVPACGWTTLRKAPPSTHKAAVKASPTTLENELVRLTITAEGELSSIVDKVSGRELARGACNSFRMYKDVPSNWDAWDIESIYKLEPVDIAGPASVEVVSEGPVVGVVRIKKKLHHSDLVQEIRLRAKSRRVDFVTSIEWRESHRLLKVNFPVDVHSDEAIQEIQFGHVRRPTHASRPYDADRFEVCNHKWTALTEENRGVAILNDCKYGVDVQKNSINLTLLKAPLAPDMNADKGLQQFTYSFYAYGGSFADSGVVEEAYDLNVPVMVIPGSGGTASLFQLDSPNVIIETVKPAEDGSGDVVLRLYEAKRTTCDVVLATTLPVRTAVETDMLERGEEKIVCKNGQIALSFRPFEIKTLRLVV